MSLHSHVLSISTSLRMSSLSSTILMAYSSPLERNTALCTDPYAP